MVVVTEDICPPQVCHKCAVPFDPICANSRLFNTSVKCFRAGLVVGKSLIVWGVHPVKNLVDSPTLNQ